MSEIAQGLKPKNIYFYGVSARLERLRKKDEKGAKRGEKHPSGAKALVILRCLSARLKSCPDTKLF